MPGLTDIPTIYDKHGNPLCSARLHTCRSCGYRFQTGDRTLVCPVCGENRQHKAVVSVPGERCRLHGASSATGIASGQWKHGRYSKHMPMRMLSDYGRSVKDRNLLVLRHDIALIDARLNDLISRVDTGEAGSLWEQAKEEYRGYRIGMAHHDKAAENYHLSQLDALLEKGISDTAAWKEIIHLLDQRRKLVEAEMKRLDRLHMFMTAEEAHYLMQAVAEAIKRHVKDKDTLGEITRELGRLVAARSGGLAATDDDQASLELADDLAVSEPGDGEELPPP